MKPVHSGKHFQQCSSSSGCYCNEYKLCIHWIIHYKSIQQFGLRQIKILTGGQPIVDFDAADKCCLYVTTLKAMNFQDHIPSLPIGNFKNHFLPAYDLTSRQDATENCQNQDD